MEQAFPLLEGSSTYSELFPWDERLNTGHRPVDAQHQVLVSLFNRLDRLLIEPSKPQLDKALAELVEYVHQHFEDEEQYWQLFLTGDDALLAHQQKHQQFGQQVASIQTQLQNMPPEEASEALVKFLLHWLIDHLINEDMQMAALVDSIAQGLSEQEARHRLEREHQSSHNIMLETLLSMYDRLASSRIALIKEQRKQQQLRLKLMQANQQLEQANQQLLRQSLTDQLTGLPNRRHLNQLFDKEHARIMREQKQLNMFLIDIDRFKQFNDRHGHLYGDRILKTVAEALQANCSRSCDYIFRAGGEEFIVLSSSQNMAQAEWFAERLRVAVAELRLDISQPLNPSILTVSVGGVCIQPQPQYLLDDYFDTADRQMYQAKSAGRNCVRLTSRMETTTIPIAPPKLNLL